MHNNSNNKTGQSSFGFKQVASEVKEKLVDQVFSSVASKYDIMNDIMSFGLHRLWKDALIKKINFKDNLKIIDMAGGTGDIALRIYNKLNNHYDNFNITIADYNNDMLNIGKNNFIDKNIIDNRINWQVVDGQKTDFPDNSFDIYTIAYGIRNFVDIETGLKEAKRILKPGGQFLCLEFSNVENKFLEKLYDFYSFQIIPRVGGLVTKDKDSYQYFVESIRMFPKPKLFAQMIADAGFTNVKYENLSAGLTTIAWALHAA